MDRQEDKPVRLNNKYTEFDLLRIGKRVNNKKRQYLLINPLQAKHMPVSPSAALHMMSDLGYQVSAVCGEARLVIGFAETATAIGAVVAHTLSPDCKYIHTTRESVAEAENYILFSEEHSHATTQKLVSDKLDALFRQTETVVFVDDEFSTGKTLLNMIAQLKEQHPILSSKKCVAASVINRLSQEHRNRWIEEGIESVCLLQLPNFDYDHLTAGIDVTRAEKIVTCPSDQAAQDIVIRYELPDPKTAVTISDYFMACRKAGNMLQNDAPLNGGDILVLGTEECMLPALLVGAQIEQSGRFNSVRCHATTRSPIGVGADQTYPIHSGWRIPSFYNPGRESYLYNMKKYDAAIIVSDSKTAYEDSLHELCALLGEHGCRRVICMVGECNA